MNKRQKSSNEIVISRGDVTLVGKRNAMNVFRSCPQMSPCRYFSHILAIMRKCVYCLIEYRYPLRSAAIIIFLCLFSLDSALSQNSSLEIIPDNPVEDTDNSDAITSVSLMYSTEGTGNSNIAVPVSFLSSREFILSVIILIFGIIIVVIEYFLVKNMISSEIEPALRIYVITLIIIGTLVLISAGYSSGQISPALGLFGTIAGYLLGRIDFRRNTDDRTTSKTE